MMEGLYWDGGMMLYDDDSDGGCSWDDTPVTFLRPDGDDEGKDIQWCLDNHFFEIEDGVWSGDWYYRDHPEERQYHEDRLKRTQEIKKRGEQRRARVRSKRESGRGLMEAQEAELISVLMGDIARLRGDYGHQQRHSNKSAAMKSQRKPVSYEKGSAEAIEKRKKAILENVIRWAEGDQGLVDRTRTAMKESDDRPFKCPCCTSWFPTEETALLHAKNANGKAHDRWRRQNGYTRDPRIRGPYYKCQCCILEFKSQELADFHLKNDPRHRNYRIGNGMAEEWDHNTKEKFNCPVCNTWFLSPEKVQEHVQTQDGKAHKRYRRDQEQQKKAEEDQHVRTFLVPSQVYSS